MFHWTVKEWLCGRGFGMCRFAIIVDENFLATTRSVEICQKTAQERARAIARQAGYPVSSTQDLLTIGEYGIERIDMPTGNGAWLTLSKRSATGKGAEYETHNVDHPHQQNFLMAVWLWWADYVVVSMTD